MHGETYVENTQIVEKCSRIGKPKNVRTNSTSELDQLFGANQKICLRKKIVLLSCFNMTYPISRLSSGSAYGFKLLIPKAEYFSEASLAN